MKLVFTSPEVPELEVIKTMLQRAGLPCELRSTTALDALGAEPSSGELWGERDADFAHARELFESWSKPAAHVSKTWVCPKCQTKLAEVFDTCWKCGDPSSGRRISRLSPHPAERVRLSARQPPPRC